MIPTDLLWLVEPRWLPATLAGLAAVLAAVACLLALRRPKPHPLVADALGDLGRDVEALRLALAEELRRARDETGAQARGLREEVGTTLDRLGGALATTLQREGGRQAEKVEGVAAQVRGLAEANERRLGELRRDSDEGGQKLRQEILRQLGSLGDLLGQRLDGGAKAQAERLAADAEAQKERLDGVTASIHRLVQSNAEANESLRKTVEGRLEILRQDNAAKLEEMRRTVDEKLQGTLEERLGEKFKIVSHHLEQVHRSVGEMQALATGVGDLKRVLTNVKSRGTWAEVSLGSLLEQVLTPDQFERNVEVVRGTRERVEYAVRLPGKGDGDTIWLPIDAKFPIEDYERLLDAADRGDPAAVEGCLKSLEARIKLEGAKISAKYVAPPHSTDFGVLYLPTEGLYAEVLRRPGLVDHLQLHCKVMVAGPSNLHAFLNSLRMGFRTLAMEKRSSEVMRTLAEVKTEFAKYGDVLDAVRKKLNEATRHIDNVDVRKRAIDRKLRDVEFVPEGEARLPLEGPRRDRDDLLDAAE